MRKLLALGLTLEELHKILGLPPTVTIIEVDRTRADRLHGDVIITIEAEGLVETHRGVDPPCIDLKQFTPEAFPSFIWKMPDV